MRNTLPTHSFLSFSFSSHSRPPPSSLFVTPTHHFLDIDPSHTADPRPLMPKCRDPPAPLTDAASHCAATPLDCPHTLP